MREAPETGDAPIELVAVINSFNRRELLEQALSSLATALREAPFECAIVVFEAGSTDRSAEFLTAWAGAHRRDHLTVLRPGHEGASFSHGINAGCTAALQQYPGCRWLLLFETDNWIAEATPLLQAISLLEQQPRLAAAGFTVRKHDGVACGYGVRFPSTLSFALGPNLALLWDLHPPNDPSWQATDTVRWCTCDVVFTSPLLIRREAWEQLGGFDADAFPFSDSDLDWAWRAARAGWGLAVIETNSVVHDNLQQASAWSATRALDFHRARLRLLRRHRGGIVALLKPVLFLRHCAEALALSLRARSDAAAQGKLQMRRQMARRVWADYC
jgi:GT2 family glycosyltransferase